MNSELRMNDHRLSLVRTCINRPVLVCRVGLAARPNYNLVPFVYTNGEEEIFLYEIEKKRNRMASNLWQEPVLWSDVIET